MFRWLVRKFRGPPDLTEAERRDLERKHARVVRRIRRIEADMARVPTAKSKKQMRPFHKQKLAELRPLRDELDEIEWKLGGEPDYARRSKREQLERRKRDARS